MTTSCNTQFMQPSFVVGGISPAASGTIPACASSDIDSIMKNNSDRVSNILQRLEMSNSNIQKAPFLPRLPEKIFSTYRINSAHLINNGYVENKQNRNESTRPLFKKEKTLAIKGDLLRASQICMVLDTSMSDTVKKIKSADTPWIRSVRPFRPTINKNKIEVSRFMSKQQPKRQNSTTNISSAPIFFTQTNEKRAHSLLNLKRGPSAKPTFQRSKTSMSTGISKFAEDLFNDHITRSLNNFQSIDESHETVSKEVRNSQQAEIAIHALDTVWELHASLLKLSPYLTELYNEQSSFQTYEYKKSLKNSKLFGSEKIERMFHIVLEITDPKIDKHCLAVTLGNMYHPNSIDVPGKLVAGTLAAANLLQFDALITEAIKRMADSLTKKTIGDCYSTSKKYNHQDAVKICESWLELYLMSGINSSLIFLKNIPLSLITKTIKSKSMFVKSEFSNLMVILYWIFFHLNPSETESPTESVIITYFSSFSKERSLVEKYPEFKDILYSNFLIANQIVEIQHMNIYPHAYLVKIMLEIQQSLGHGGDMNIVRGFENSALRHGFTIDVDKQNHYSEIFSLYGFHFELITEKIEQKDNTYIYQFHIQRLTSKNPVLTYEQSQLEMFSLRNDRLCCYSISVQFWNEGRQVYESTGQKHHVFGIAKSQLSPIFEIEFPFTETDVTIEDYLCKKTKQLNVMYSFVFPVD